MPDDENVMILDFEGIAPVYEQGGQSDYVPPGVYKLQVTKAERVRTRDGKHAMIDARLSVAEGDAVGSRLRDNFTIPNPGEDQKYGLQRFAGFLLRLGIQLKMAKTRVPLDRLPGKQAWALVGDDVFNGRTVSRVLAYLTPEEAAEQQAAFVRADIADGLGDIEDAEEVVAAAPAPNGRKRAAAPAAVAEPDDDVATTGGSETADIDSMFD